MEHRSATLLMTDEVADALRVSRGSVYRLLERGELYAVRLGSGPKARIRVADSELERFLADHTRKDTP